MSAPTSLAETLAKVTYQHLRTSTSGWYDSAPVVGCACGVGLANTPHADHVARAQAEAARAWLVARLNEHGPPEVLVGALTNMIEAASQARDDCHDDLRRSWHQGRVSALMDAKRQTESWVAALTEVLTDD